MNDIETIMESPIAERDEQGRFLPGVSGNPNGRPKLLEEFTALAQEKTVEALEVIIDILHDSEARTVDRLRAADIILDRGLGKPLQSSQVDLIGDVRGRMIEVIFADPDLEKWSR